MKCKVLTKTRKWDSVHSHLPKSLPLEGCIQIAIYSTLVEQEGISSHLFVYP